MARPLKFETVEELTEKIDEYFNTVDIKEWTITGLALHLDTFRSLLCDYEKKDKFYYTIKKAKQMVEHSYELDLKKTGRTGTIFALKNFDWKDRQEFDHVVEDKTNYSDEQIETIAKRTLRNGESKSEKSSD